MHSSSHGSSLHSLMLAVTLGAAVLGCRSMHTPANGEQVCGANANVRFTGYTPKPNESVQIQVAAQVEGPWTTVGSASTASSGHTIEDFTYYRFDKSFQLAKWTSVAEGGAQLRTYVRARIYDAGATPYATWRTLDTFDVTLPTGSTPLACMQARMQAGDTSLEAHDYCASSEAPNVRLLAPAQTTCGGCTNVVVKGNVIIDSALSAAQYVCTQTINGSLTITENAPETVALPALSTLSGGVTLDYSYPYKAFGQTHYRRRNIQLPGLVSIGGDVTLTARRTQGTPKAYPQGLDAVTSVGGDITITVHDTNPDVFASLASHAGDLTIQGFENGSLDVSLSGSFESLEHVTGDVLVQRFFSTNGVLNHLETIGGNLTVGELRLYPSPSFTSLQSVTGDFYFVAMKGLGGAWNNPVTIGGELGFVGHANVANFSSLPLANAQAFALRVEDNAALSNLDGTSFQLGAGNVVIAGNPSLSQCAVSAFLATQQAGGWTGSASVSNTLPCTP